MDPNEEGQTEQNQQAQKKQNNSSVTNKLNSVVIKDEKFKKNKLPVELNLFIKLYRPNLKKISHKKLMTNLSLIISFDVALILVITEISDKLVLKLCIGLFLVIILMRTSYDLYAKYLDKRGMIEHE